MRKPICRAMALCAITMIAAIAAAQESPTVYTAADGVALPVPTKTVAPNYTPEAMQNRIEGSVGLSAVVLVDGTVGEVKVVRSLDSTYGLDDAAVAAMKQWEFKPGTKDSKAVAVRISVDMTFTLK